MWMLLDTLDKRGRRDPFLTVLIHPPLCEDVVGPADLPFGFDDLPDEIVELILSRLPQSSLPSAALVSRRWSALCCSHERRSVSIKADSLPEGLWTRLSWHRPSQLSLGPWGSALSENALDQLRVLRSLKSLRIYSRVKDAHLQCRLPPQLTSLTLFSCKDVSESGLAHLSRLTRLNSLDLHSLTAVKSDQSLGFLTALPALKVLTVDLEYGRLSERPKLNGSWATSFTSLRHLEARVTATDELLRTLAARAGHSLRSLDLWGCQEVTDVGLSSLTALYNLRCLGLTSCSAITSHTLNNLTGLYRLTSLEIDYSRDFTFDPRAVQLHRLTSLSVPSVPVQGAFDRYTALCDLKMGWDGMTAADVAPLSTFSSLTSLSLHHCPVNREGMGHVARHSALKYLHLFDCDIADGALLPVAANSITSLSFSSSRTMSSDVSYLTAFSALERLRLSHCDRLNDRSMEQLAWLTQLKALTVFHCESVTDVGVLHLSTLHGARLDLKGDGITAHGLASLKEQQMKVKADRSRPPDGGSSSASTAEPTKPSKPSEFPWCSVM